MSILVDWRNLGNPHAAKVGHVEQVAAELAKHRLPIGRAMSKTPTRARRGGARVRALVDSELAFGGNEDGEVIHAFATVDGPSPWAMR